MSFSSPHPASTDSWHPSQLHSVLEFLVIPLHVAIPKVPWQLSRGHVCSGRDISLLTLPCARIPMQQPVFSYQYRPGNHTIQAVHWQPLKVHLEDTKRIRKADTHLFYPQLQRYLKLLWSIDKPSLPPRFFKILFLDLQFFIKVIDWYIECPLKLMRYGIPKLKPFCTGTDKCRKASELSMGP